MKFAIVNKSRCCITLLMVFFISQANAQYLISGTVVDSTNKAVQFAKVFTKLDGGEQIIDGSMSDSLGNFSIEVPKQADYRLFVDFIGFEKREQKVTVAGDVDLGEIVLLVSSDILGPVDVYGQRPVIEREGDKLVFNVQSSPLKSGYDGMEVLERSPIIWVDNGGAITMRNEAVTVMINGRVVNMSGQDLENYLKTLNSDDIEKIEIQTGASANIDGESSGGVVNIVLSRKQVGFNARFKTVYTFRNLSNYMGYGGIDFDYGLGKWNIYGTWNYMQDKDASVTNSDISYFTTSDLLTTYRESNDFLERRNYKLGFVVEPIKNHVFGVEGYFPNSNNKFSNVSDVQMKNAEVVIDEGITTFDNLALNDLFNTTLNYSWAFDTLGSKLQVFGDYSTQDYSNVNNAASIYELGFFEGNQEINSTSSATEIYTGQVNLDKNLRNGLAITTGGKYTSTDRNNSLISNNLVDGAWVNDEDRTTAFDYQELITAGYLSLGKEIKERNYLKIGMRVENTQINKLDLLDSSEVIRDYTNWLPTFYLSRELKNKEILSFRYSRRIRRPSFTLLNNNVRKINDFRFELGNPNLNPEYVNKLELMLGYKRQSFTVYYNQIDDVINGVYFLDGNIAYYQKVNAGTQKQFGLDYNIYKYIKKKWYLKVSTGAFHRYFTNPEGVNQFARTTFYFNAYANVKITKTLDVDLVGYYISPREDAYYIADQRYSFDVVIKKSFFDKKLNCRLYFDDVFNTLVYQNVREFDTFRTTASEKPLTRSVSFWLTYNLSNNKANERRNKSKNDAKDRL